MSLQQEIERLRNKTAQEETLGLIGRSLLKTPIGAGVTQDNWKDALVASILKGVVGGGLAGMGQARADEQSQSLLAEALGAGGLREQFDAGQDIAESDYSPELAGIVGSIVGQKYEDERRLDLLDKQYEAQYGARAKYAAPKPTIADEIAKRKQLNEAGVANYGKPPVTNINTTSELELSDPGKKKANQASELRVGLEGTISSLDDLTKYLSTLPKEQNSLIGMKNTIARKVKEFALGSLRQAKQAGVELELQEILKGIPSDFDAGKIITWITGGGALNRVDLQLEALNSVKGNIIKSYNSKITGIADSLKDLGIRKSDIEMGDRIRKNFLYKAEKPTISKESALAELKRRGVL